MRTKTLLCVAAIAAASIASASAQAVYSVNAVGYVNKKVPAKSFALIANPLNAPTGSNTISALLTGMVPGGAQVYAWNTGTKGFDIANFDTDFGWDYSNPAMATQEFKPGSGFFVLNPSNAEITITFVGEVPQGSLSVALVPGFQIVGSPVPQAGTPTDLGYVGADGDSIYQWNTATQGYVPSQFDTVFGWDPPLQSMDVGDAFFLSKTTAGSWTRTFSVGQ